MGRSLFCSGRVMTLDDGDNDGHNKDDTKVKKNVEED